MSSFAPNDVLLDIEKLETMLTNSSSSSCDSSSSNCPSLSPTSRSLTATARFTGSSKVYLRNLNKLLADIEQKQKILSVGGGSVLKRLRPLDSSSSARPLTFTSLFSRPSVKCVSNNRLEPKTISFAQLITQNSPFSMTYSNHQSEYGCARLNEKMWVVHCREQLTKAVNDEMHESGRIEVRHKILKRCCLVLVSTFRMMSIGITYRIIVSIINGHRVYVKMLGNNFVILE